MYCAGGKLLVLYGGISRSPNPSHETVGREVAVLNMETMLWDKPGMWYLSCCQSKLD
jgi:hypothetical protein